MGMGFHSHSAMVKAGSTVSKVIGVIKVVNKLLKVNRQSGLISQLCIRPLTFHLEQSRVTAKRRRAAARRRWNVRWALLVRKKWLLVEARRGKG